MKKRILPFIFVLAFISACDDSDSPYAAGWTQTSVDAAIEECVDDGESSREECECTATKTAERIPMRDLENLSKLSEILEASIEIALECGGLDFTDDE